MSDCNSSQRQVAGKSAVHSEDLCSHLHVQRTVHNKGQALRLRQCSVQSYAKS